MISGAFCHRHPLPESRCMALTPGVDSAQAVRNLEHRRCEALVPRNFV